MDINIKVTHTLDADTLAAIKSIFSHENTAPVAEAKNGKVKEQAKRVAEEVKQEEKTTGTDAAATVKKTIVDVRAAVQKKSQAGKKEQVKSLLAEFGTDKVTNLAADQYEDFYAKVEAL